MELINPCLYPDYDFSNDLGRYLETFKMPQILSSIADLC